LFAGGQVPSFAGRNLVGLPDHTLPALSAGLAWLSSRTKRGGIRTTACEFLRWYPIITTLENVDETARVAFAFQ
jgi:hypothetical protein